MAWWDDAFKAVGDTAGAVGGAIGGAVKAVGDFVAPVTTPVAQFTGSVIKPLIDNPITHTALQTGGNLLGACVGMPLLGTMVDAGLTATVNVVSGADSVVKTANSIGVAVQSPSSGGGGGSYSGTTVVMMGRDSGPHAWAHFATR